ncbi:MAG TPA: type II toxin-antitoxin system VapC family toxin [Syntrophales bacterium]|nr:type II toxin-antitoxin system VapC family toxin [Syntrophales bacterium]
MQSIYLETTIPSYLVAKLSSNIIVAAEQILTREWWDQSQMKYDLYVSEAVIDECSAGDQEAAQKRMELIRNMHILAINEEIVNLSVTYGAVLNLPERSKVDALHLALAVYYEMNYLLTWNCRHLAHGEVRSVIHNYNSTHGLFEPMIVTPMELMERSQNNVR